MNAAGVVYVVDDDASFRAAVTGMLTAAGLRVQSCASGRELLAHLSRDEATAGFGCVVTDLRIPGLDGLQVQEACRSSGMGLPFVFLTGQVDVPSVVSAMRHGAVDVIDRCAPQNTLLASVDRALQQDARERAARRLRGQLERRFAALTDREKDVLRHVVQGKMNKQIAASIGIHERTVKKYRSAVTVKLGVRSVAELTMLTHEAGVFAELQ